MVAASSNLPNTLQGAQLRWTLFLARCMVSLTFPLIFIGGLVTTTQAGMAVPDWPGTFGYNLWLYPWETWFFGPWDIFVEHGHRLLATLVGLTAIAMNVGAAQERASREMRWACFVALFLVCVQGGLGGARVLLAQRTVAMLHGWLGPTFFAYSCWLAHALSRPRPRTSRVTDISLAAMFAAAACLMQLGFGALVRHVPATAATSFFQAAVYFHIVGAALVVVAVLRLAWMVRGAGKIAERSRWLASLVLLQGFLGVATWLSKYNWPLGVSESLYVPAFTIESGSMTQSIIVTSHVALGSLILAESVVLAARCNWPQVSGTSLGEPNRLELSKIAAGARS